MILTRQIEPTMMIVKFQKLLTKRDRSPPYSVILENQSDHVQHKYGDNVTKSSVTPTKWIVNDSQPFNLPLVTRMVHTQSID